MGEVQTFQRNIIEAGVLDPEAVHHEFVSGMHGRKLDFDTIPIGSPLYVEWINVATNFISSEFPQLPQIIMGVANGTNRVALDIARRFDGQVVGAASEKDSQSSKVLKLSPLAGRLVSALEPELVVVIEDVGTTGSNSAQVARHCLESGAQSVEVVTTWQRRPQLEKLEEAGIPYRAIINETLPIFTPEECTDTGYCSQGWQFIPR